VAGHVCEMRTIAVEIVRSRPVVDAKEVSVRRILFNARNAGRLDLTFDVGASA